MPQCCGDEIFCAKVPRHTQPSAPLADQKRYDQIADRTGQKARGTQRASISVISATYIV